MLVFAIALSLSAAPTSEFDRLSNTTLWVEANKGLNFLIPVGNELRIRTEGRDKAIVNEAQVRFWATLAAGSAPTIGILAGDTGIGAPGALLVDGTRIDSVSCGMPPVPTPMGRFTTWHRDIGLSAKALRGLANARKKIEIACGSRVEVIVSVELASFVSAAKLFAASTFPHDVAEQMKRQKEFDRKAEEKEREERPTASPPGSVSPVALGGEMAALRARKMVQVADCIANEFEEHEDAKTDVVTKKCKGFIDSNGNLISAK